MARTSGTRHSHYQPITRVCSITRREVCPSLSTVWPQRIGAPITGFTRISDEPIEIHSAIYDPDIVIVLDDTVPKIVNVTNGLKKNGMLLENSKKNPKDLKNELGLDEARCYSVDATRISIEIMGSGRAFNTAMLGALVRAEPLVSSDTLSKVLRERFRKDVAEKNISVLMRANTEVVEG